MAEDGLKTEQPTEKRLREAVEEGQFPKTPDIHTVMVLAAAAMTLMLLLESQCRQVASITISILGHLGRYTIEPQFIAEWTPRAIGAMLMLVLPLGLACAGAGLLAGGLQSRFRLTPKALAFKPERLNPADGFKRVFSMQGWVKLGTDGLKLTVIGGVLYSSLQQILSDPVFYTPVDALRLGQFLNGSLLMLLGRFVLALGGIAALNYLYQRHKVGKDMMMSRHEVKEENRSAEGDPLVRAAQRQMARRLMARQMLAAVATADVVVTNPTHFAVALKYERGKDSAPIVLAKGERLFAKRIKALAKEHEVPMIENKPVARMLFKYGKVGQSIPMEMFQAVAEILAHVYKTHRYYFHRLPDRRAQADRNGGLAG